MEGLDKVPTVEKITYRTVTLDVLSSGSTFKNKAYNFDNTIERVTGLAISSDSMDNDARYYDITCGVAVNGTKVLPTDFEASILACAPSVPTADRFLSLNETASNGLVEIEVKDRGSLGGSYPYKLFFTFRCIAK